MLKIPIYEQYAQSHWRDNTPLVAMVTGCGTYSVVELAVDRVGHLPELLAEVGKQRRTDRKRGSQIAKLGETDRTRSEASTTCAPLLSKDI